MFYPIDLWRKQSSWLLVRPCWGLRSAIMRLFLFEKSSPLLSFGRWFCSTCRSVGFLTELTSLRLSVWGPNHCPSAWFGCSTLRALLLSFQQNRDARPFLWIYAARCNAACGGSFSCMRDSVRRSVYPLMFGWVFEFLNVGRHVCLGRRV